MRVPALVAVLAAELKAEAFNCLTVFDAERYTLSLASMSPPAVKDLFTDTRPTIPAVIAALRASVVSFVA